MHWISSGTRPSTPGWSAEARGTRQSRINPLLEGGENLRLGSSWYPSRQIFRIPICNHPGLDTLAHPPSSGENFIFTNITVTRNTRDSNHSHEQILANHRISLERVMSGSLEKPTNLCGQAPQVISFTSAECESETRGLRPPRSRPGINRKSFQLLARSVSQQSITYVQFQGLGDPRRQHLFSIAEHHRPSQCWLWMTASRPWRWQEGACGADSLRP